jgi:hypothetical protein
MPQPLRHKHSRPSGRRVAVILGGLLAVAVVVTATTYRTPGDSGSRAQTAEQPVPAAAASATPAPPAGTATARTTEPKAVLQAATTSIEAPATVGSAGQRVHIDPVTKRIRETEHDDAAALAAKAPVQRRALRTAGLEADTQILYPSGAIGMTVPEELHTSVVATRTPDGRIVLEHASGPKAAQAKTRAGAVKARTTEKKEEPNVR